MLHWNVLFFSLIEILPGCMTTATIEEGFQTISLNSTHNTVTLASPGFENGSYSINMEYKWEIVAAQSKKIQLKFDVFELEEQEKCLWDYVELADKQCEDKIYKTSQRFCGNRTNLEYNSSIDVVCVYFKSDVIITKRGFKAVATIINDEDSFSNEQPSPNQSGSSYPTEIASTYTSPSVTETDQSYKSSASLITSSVTSSPSQQSSVNVETSPQKTSPSTQSEEVTTLLQSSSQHLNPSTTSMKSISSVQSLKSSNSSPQTSFTTGPPTVQSPKSSNSSLKTSFTTGSPTVQSPKSSNSSPQTSFTTGPPTVQSPKSSNSSPQTSFTTGPPTVQSPKSSNSSPQTSFTTGPPTVQSPKSSNSSLKTSFTTGPPTVQSPKSSNSSLKTSFTTGPPTVQSPKSSNSSLKTSFTTGPPTVQSPKSSNSSLKTSFTTGPPTVQSPKSSNSSLKTSFTTGPPTVQSPKSSNSSLKTSFTTGPPTVQSPKSSNSSLKTSFTTGPPTVQSPKSSNSSLKTSFTTGSPTVQSPKSSNSSLKTSFTTGPPTVQSPKSSNSSLKTSFTTGSPTVQSPKSSNSSLKTSFTTGSPTVQSPKSSNSSLKTSFTTGPPTVQSPKSSNSSLKTSFTTGSPTVQSPKSSNSSPQTSFTTGPPTVQSPKSSNSSLKTSFTTGPPTVQSPKSSNSSLKTSFTTGSPTVQSPKSSNSSLKTSFTTGPPTVQSPKSSNSSLKTSFTTGSPTVQSPKSSNSSPQTSFTTGPPTVQSPKSSNSSPQTSFTTGPPTVQSPKSSNSSPQTSFTTGPPTVQSPKSSNSSPQTSFTTGPPTVQSPKSSNSSPQTSFTTGPPTVQSPKSSNSSPQTSFTTGSPTVQSPKSSNSSPQTSFTTGPPTVQSPKSSNSSLKTSFTTGPPTVQSPKSSNSSLKTSFTTGPPTVQSPKSSNSSLKTSFTTGSPTVQSPKSSNSSPQTSFTTGPPTVQSPKSSNSSPQTSFTTGPPTVQSPKSSNSSLKTSFTTGPPTVQSPKSSNSSPQTSFTTGPPTVQSPKSSNSSPQTSFTTGPPTVQSPKSSNSSPQTSFTTGSPTVQSPKSSNSSLKTSFTTGSPTVQSPKSSNSSLKTSFTTGPPTVQSPKSSNSSLKTSFTTGPPTVQSPKSSNSSPQTSYTTTTATVQSPIAELQKPTGNITLTNGTMAEVDVKGFTEMFIQTPKDVDTGKYPLNFNSTLFVQNTNNLSLTITFESFKLEKNQHCTWDFLVIKNPYTKLCGDVIPNPITTSVQRLQMTFFSDMIIPDDGFVLRIIKHDGNTKVPTTTTSPTTHLVHTTDDTLKPPANSSSLSPDQASDHSSATPSPLSSSGQSLTLLTKITTDIKDTPTTIPSSTSHSTASKSQGTLPVAAHTASLTTIFKSSSSVSTPSPAVYSTKPSTTTKQVTTSVEAIPVDSTVEQGQSLFPASSEASQNPIHNSSTSPSNSIQPSSSTFSTQTTQSPATTTNGSLQTISAAAPEEFKEINICSEDNPKFDDKMYVVSPGFIGGNNYPMNVMCNINFTVSKNENITMVIDRFQVERSSMCKWDSLNVKFGDQSYKLCGNQPVFQNSTDVNICDFENFVQYDTFKKQKACFIDKDMSHTISVKSDDVFTLTFISDHIVSKSGFRILIKRTKTSKETPTSTSNATPPSKSHETTFESVTVSSQPIIKETVLTSGTNTKSTTKKTSPMPLSSYETISSSVKTSGIDKTTSTVSVNPAASSFSTVTPLQTPSSIPSVLETTVKTSVDSLTMSSSTGHKVTSTTAINQSPPVSSFVSVISNPNLAATTPSQTIASESSKASTQILPIMNSPNDSVTTSPHTTLTHASSSNEIPSTKSTTMQQFQTMSTPEPQGQREIDICSNSTTEFNDTIYVVSPGFSKGQRYPVNTDCNLTFRGSKNETFTLILERFRVEFNPTCKWDSLNVKFGDQSYKLCGNLPNLQNPYYDDPCNSANFVQYDNLKQSSNCFIDKDLSHTFTFLSARSLTLQFISDEIVSSQGFRLLIHRSKNEGENPPMSAPGRVTVLNGQESTSLSTSTESKMPNPTLTKSLFASTTLTPTLQSTIDKSKTPTFTQKHSPSTVQNTTMTDQGKMTTASNPFLLTPDITKSSIKSSTILSNQKPLEGGPGVTINLPKSTIATSPSSTTLVTDMDILETSKSSLKAITTGTSSTIISSTASIPKTSVSSSASPKLPTTSEHNSRTSSTLLSTLSSRSIIRRGSSTSVPDPSTSRLPSSSSASLIQTTPSAIDTSTQVSSIHTTQPPQNSPTSPVSRLSTNYQSTSKDTSPVTSTASTATHTTTTTTTTSVSSSATVTELPPACSSDGQPLSLLDDIGVIESPKTENGSTYPPNSLCRWKIEDLNNQLIMLVFEWFDIEQSNGCRWDKLGIYEIKTGSDRRTVAVLCGNELPQTITVASNVLIEFKSDTMEQKSGFRLKFLKTDMHKKGEDLTCLPGMTPCWPTMKCMPVEWMCDGESDCPDHTDELKCVKCPVDEFSCGDGHCITQDKRCDGHHDCPYGLDEHDCVSVEDNGEVSVMTNGELMPLCHSPAVVTHKNLVCKAALSRLATEVWSEPLDSSNRDRVAWMTVNDQLHDNIATMATVGFSKSKTCASESTSLITCINNDCGHKQKLTHARRKRIIGGAPSQQGDWPWVVALRLRNKMICGGTIIDRQWVLTAGHCVKDIAGNPQIASVVAGVHDINDVSAQIRYVTEVVIHPEYDFIFNADIALLKMELPFIFNKNVQQICLPWDGRNFSLSSKCFIAGWGVSDMTEYYTTVAPRYLRHAKTKLFSAASCIKSYATYSSVDAKIKDSMVCAGYSSGSIDACKGDSGGGLMCEVSAGRWALTGVVSWGDQCGRTNKPGVYTKVTSFLGWINETLGHAGNSNVTCSFETSDWCGYQSLSNTTYIWTRRPAEKWTLGHMLYAIRADQDLSTLANATLLTPQFNSGQERCLEFQFLFSGNSNITLSVYGIPDDTLSSAHHSAEILLWRTISHYPATERWQTSETGVPADISRLKFVSLHDHGGISGLGLDNVTLKSIPCTKSNFMKCNFNNQNMCQYTNPTNSVFNKMWQIKHKGKSKKDFVLETGGNYSTFGIMAISQLVSPLLMTSFTSLPHCLSFNFYKEYNNSNELKVVTYSSIFHQLTNQRLYWSSQGAVIGQWTKVDVSVLKISEYFDHIVLEVRRDTDGDVRFMIDNLSIYNGYCL